MYKMCSCSRKGNQMKTRIVSFILSLALATYPVMGSAVAETPGRATGARIVSLNAVTKVSTKRERQKKIKTCFKLAMRAGVIPETTDHIELKSARCRDDSFLIVAVVPVSILDELQAQEQFEEEMHRLLSRTRGLDRPLGLLVEFVGEDFYAAFDMSVFLRSEDGPVSLIAAGGDLTEFEALFGMAAEDFVHLVRSLVDPQVFYSAGGTILKWTAAGAAAGAAVGAGAGLIGDAANDGNPTPSGLPGRFQQIDNGSDSVGDGAGWGAAIGGAIGAGVGFVIGVAVAIYDAATGDDEDDDDEDEDE